jgi:hypothetical protein
MCFAMGRGMSSSIRAAIVLVSFASLLACGGTGENVSGGSPDPHAEGGAGSAGAGGADAGGHAGSGGSATAEDSGAKKCELAPKGEFTFHIRNGGTSLLRLALGCGAKLPIDLDTPDGKLGIGPGNADACERSCDLVYDSPIPQCPGFCTDCANGKLVTIGSGATGDMEWDRRVYVPKMAEQRCLADPSCPSGKSCAFGIAVAPKANQMGTLTICTDPNAQGVYCATSRTVSFTVDTTAQEGTIEVN